MRARAVVVAALLAAGLPTGCDDDEPPFGGRTFLPRAAETPGKFDPRLVRGYHYFNEPGGQRREVHFVAPGPRSTHLRQAEQCVEHHLEEEDVAAPFCYAYPSHRAFDASKFKPDNGQTGPNCWSAMAYKPLEGERDSSVATEDALGNEGCPDLF